MKKILFAIILMAVGIACSHDIDEPSSQTSSEQEGSVTDDDNNKTSAGSNISVSIGAELFAATLADTAAAEAFKAMLPLTVEMSEMNGNEYYGYLSDILPSETSHVGTINIGDLMLYGSSCVVVFTKHFRHRIPILDWVQ